MVVGALWAGIAGLLKVTRGVSEVISTIMLNSIAGTAGRLPARPSYGDQYGQRRAAPTPIPDEQPARRLAPVRAPRTGPIWTLRPARRRSSASAVWFLLNRTRFGFDLRATGCRDRGGRQRVNVKRMVVISMLLSGAVAGLVGMPPLFGGADYYGPTFQRRLGLHRHRDRAARPQPPARHRVRRAAVRLPRRAGQPARLIRPTSRPTIVLITQGVIVLSVVIAYELVRR